MTILNDEADSELTFALGKVRNFQPVFFYRIASTASKTTTTKVQISFFKDVHLQNNRCHYLPRKIQQQTNHTSLMWKSILPKTNNTFSFSTYQNLNTKILICHGWYICKKKHSFSGWSLLLMRGFNMCSSKNLVSAETPCWLFRLFRKNYYLWNCCSFMFLSGINCKIDIFVKLLDFPLLIHIEHKNGHKQSPFQLVPGIGKTETFYRIFFTFCSLASVKILPFGFPDRWRPNS